MTNVWRKSNRHEIQMRPLHVPKICQLPIQSGEIEGREEESTMYCYSRVLGLRPTVPVPPPHWWVLPKHLSWQGPRVQWGEQQHECWVSSGWMQTVGTGTLPSLRLERWVRVPGPGLGLVTPGYKQMAPLPISHKAPEHAPWLKEDDLPFKGGNPPFA